MGARAVDELADRTADKSALAMRAFARALRQLPIIIADNGGFDSADLITKLQAAHVGGSTSACLNMETGTIGDALDLHITESFKVKSSVLSSAAEAEMILRVDEIIKPPPAQRTDY